LCKPYAERQAKNHDMALISHHTYKAYSDSFQNVDDSTDIMHEKAPEMLPLEESRHMTFTVKMGKQNCCNDHIKSSLHRIELLNAL
jgi:hypothetical protein